MVEKEWSLIVNKTILLKMLPQFYQAHLQKYLTSSQLLNLKLLVVVLQLHKQIRIERLAALLPLPVLYESRRRHIQRFLKLPCLSVALIWFPIIKNLIEAKIKPGSRLYVRLGQNSMETE